MRARGRARPKDGGSPVSDFHLYGPPDDLRDALAMVRAELENDEQAIEFMLDGTDLRATTLVLIQYAASLATAGCGSTGAAIEHVARAQDRITAAERNR